MVRSLVINYMTPPVDFVDGFPLIVAEPKNARPMQSSVLGWCSVTKSGRHDLGGKMQDPVRERGPMVIFGQSFHDL